LSRAGDLRQWDLESDNLDLSFAVEFHGLATFQFSDDSRRFLTIGKQSAYNVWNAERGIRLMSLAANASPKRGSQILADGVLSADGNTLYTADHANSAVQVWDTLAQRRLYDIEHHAEAVTSVALSHDGGQLLVASADGFAELTQVRPNTIHREQSVVFNPGSLSIDASGQYLVTAGAKGAQGFVQRRDLKQLDTVETFTSYPTYFFNVQWDSTSQYVVAGAQNGKAVIYDASSGLIMNQLPAVAAPIESISISQNRLLVKPWSIPGVEVATASLWSLPQGEKLSSMQHARAIYDARFGQRGNVVATAGDDGQVAVWSSADGQLINKFSASENAVYSLDFSNVGAQIATADASGHVAIWNYRDGSELFGLADAAIGTPLYIRFSVEGDALAIGTSTGAWLWRPSSAELLEMSGQQDVVKFAFLHAGKILLAGGLDGSVVAWDTLSGEHLGRIASHYGPVRGFAVDPTEAILATADFNGEFALWNLAIETRDSNSVKIDLKCKIPWQLLDGKLSAAVPGCQTRKSPIKNSS
ncbi:MAG: WD40 repeat domain-containing protein, partial [Oceanococcus sp.]